jgi:hypothetical protein
LGDRARVELAPARFRYAPDYTIGPPRIASSHTSFFPSFDLVTVLIQGNLGHQLPGCGQNSAFEKTLSPWPVKEKWAILQQHEICPNAWIRTLLTLYTVRQRRDSFLVDGTGDQGGRDSFNLLPNYTSHFSHSEDPLLEADCISRQSGTR